MSGILAALGQQAVERLSLAERLLRPESLIRRTGAAELLAPYGGDAPLRILLDDYGRHARLNLVGCFAARFEVRRMLDTLAALRAREAREPALLEAPIERPIIVTGLPRSGTTFLHKLLAADPASRVPATWETIFPLPRGRHDPPERRIATVARQLALFDRMAPRFREVHPIDAASPQECTEITAHVFRSFRFETTHHVPGFRAWLRGADHLPTYRFHRVFLQHLQHNDGAGPRRWVLKAPDHVFALEALAEVYPDACMVFLHRDPLDVLASVAGLTEILRRPFASVVDRQAIGRQVVTECVKATSAMLRADAKALFPPGRVLHLRFADLVRDPLSAVAGLYGHFGLDLSEAALGRLEQLVAATPRGGYAGVTHALEDYGIDAEEVRAQCAAYAGRFGL